MKTFYIVLLNTFIASVTNNFLWFALTFWVYLETKSVLATSIIAGIYLVITAFSGFWLGGIVDHHKKKISMILSSTATLGFFLLGYLLYISFPESTFTSITNPVLWIIVSLLLLGVIAGNIRNIALPTLVTILVPVAQHDKANGLSGTIMGLSFTVCAVFSGLTLAYLGLNGVLLISLSLTLLALLHLFFVPIPEKKLVHTTQNPKKLDIRGTLKVVIGIPGLLALILFATINNFLGGVFMALMDAYGLSLVPVQVWGIMWGVLSFGFIFGGLYIAKRGLGKNPLRTLFLANVAMWTVSIFFAIQPSIILLSAGMFAWMSLVPFAEAAEQTIIQKVVPPERQGRVFGFSQSVEQAASPLTAFAIGPIAQFFFIPFMTDGLGVKLIGGWFGVGQGRGIALVFIAAGTVGLIITLLAMRTKSYKLLNKAYLEG